MLTPFTLCCWVTISKKKKNHKIMLDFIVLFDHKYVTILRCPLPSYWKNHNICNVSMRTYFSILWRMDFHSGVSVPLFRKILICIYIVLGTVYIMHKKREYMLDFLMCKFVVKISKSHFIKHKQWYDDWITMLVNIRLIVCWINFLKSIFKRNIPLLCSKTNHAK